MQRVLGLFILAICLGSCSDSIIAAAKSMMTLSPTKVWVEKVQFKVADDMNNNAPVTVHLVIPYKQETYDALSKMTAEDYFSKHEQLKKDNPNMLDVNVWELVPGQSKEEQTIVPTRVDGLGVIIFARYATPGEHRVAVADDRQIRIILEKLDFRSEKIS